MKCPKCDAENTQDSQFCKKCAASLTGFDESQRPITQTIETPREELTTGSTFAGRYQIIEELGKGGMGKVYKALDTKINEKIALKLIKPEIASDKKIIERFSNELKLARKVGHRNVGRMFHLAEDDGTHYITMEYVSGEDLKSMIRMSGQLGIGTAINIAKQICEGLTEAHRMGVIHRDLKPSNIMIDKGGNARIMDFGIARSLRTKGLTGSGVMIGTPEYMSPEQVEAKDVDQRSDIYSLGVILYEMVTGRVPFVGDSPFSIGVKHKSEEPEDPIKYNSRIPEDLSRVILKCLEKEKERRYQNSKNVCSELIGLEEGFPISETELPRQKSTTSRDITVSFKRRWLFITIPVFVLLVAALVIILKNGKEVISQETKVLVVLPFDNLGHPEDEYFANGITDDIRNRLSVIPELELISSTSAIQYKKTEKSIQQIREELDVDYVVTGNVRWEKSEGERGRVHVSPQLIRASDDTQIWSEDYKEPIENISGVQANISEKIVRQLDLTLLEPARKVLEAKPTDNPDAYDFYLRGREHYNNIWASLNYQEAEHAVVMYEKAIELDPFFTGAYTALSLIHTKLYFFGIDRTEARLTKAKAAVEKALEIKPDSPEATLSLAFYHFWGLLDHELALEIYESVQKVRPNVSVELKGSIHAAQGKFEEALTSLEKTFKLDPRSPTLSRNISYIYRQMRRYEEAEAWLDRSLFLSPENATTMLAKIINSYVWKGNTKEARSFFAKFPPGPFADLAWMYMEYQDRNFAEVINRLDRWPLDSFGIGNLYVNKDLSYAMSYYRQGKTSLVKPHADSARITLEDLTRQYPKDPKYHSALGEAYAYLGRKEDAISEGNLAVKLHPISKDAVYGPSNVYFLALTLIIVGEHDEALDKLEYLMSIPAGASVSMPLLKHSPRFDPLRDLPRFKRLLEKYSNED